MIKGDRCTQRKWGTQVLYIFAGPLCSKQNFQVTATKGLHFKHRTRCHRINSHNSHGINLPRDQLPRDQLIMRWTLTGSTCHEMNSIFVMLCLMGQENHGANTKKFWSCWTVFELEIAAYHKSQLLSRCFFCQQIFTCTCQIITQSCDQNTEQIMWDFWFLPSLLMC